MPGRNPSPRCLLLGTRRRTLRGMIMMRVRRCRSLVFLLSHSGEPFLSHLTIDSLSVLTRDPVPGIFELGAQTLGECLLGSLVLDKMFSNKFDATFHSTESRQDPTLLTCSSYSPSDRWSFASSSSGRHDVNNDPSQGCRGCFYDLSSRHVHVMKLTVVLFHQFVRRGRCQIRNGVVHGLHPDQEPVKLFHR